MEIIRSRQNPLAKLLLKLSDSRRERQKARLSLLVGTHLVEAALDRDWPLAKLLLCEGMPETPEISALLARSPVGRVMLERELFCAIEQTVTPTGMMAVCALPDTPPLCTEGLVLLLEGVQDPGNVGSMLRTAAAAGAAQVWLTPGCADLWSPKVLRAGMGAHFLLPAIERINVDTALATFSGPLAVTTLGDATPLHDSPLKGSLVLALGSEGGGVSDSLLARADLRLRIPMAEGVESLNVAAAAAICLYEHVRQSR